MKFYYCNGLGDKGYFSEDCIVKAIYTAWNIEANLFLLKNNINKINENGLFNEQAKLIFSPLENNSFNSKLLKEYGYKMKNGIFYRYIVDIETNEIIRYKWSEVKQLV